MITINSFYLYVLSFFDGNSSPIKDFIDNSTLHNLIIKRRIKFCLIHTFCILLGLMFFTILMHFFLSIPKNYPVYYYIPKDSVVWISLIAIEIFSILIILLSPFIIIRSSYKIIEKSKNSVILALIE